MTKKYQAIKESSNPLLKTRTKNSNKKSIRREINFQIKYRDDFINITSHQLRTPLSTIQSSIELLELYIKKGNAARQLQTLNKVKKSISYLKDVIENITELYKKEKQKQKLNVSKIVLREFINELIEEIIVQASENHLINVNIEYPEKYIYGDEFILKQILVNLLINSIKFSPEGGQIQMSVRKSNKYLELSIKDEGIGIDEKDIKKIFQPFYRANNATDIPGIGLGLAIVKKLIKIHKGKIKCYSSLGNGTEFQIFIPLKL